MDKRLIEKIEDYTKGLDLVNNMQPVTFNQKGKLRKQLGLVSQNVLDLEPLAVIQGQGYSIEYNTIIPILINAIKDLSKEVEELKTNNTKKGKDGKK